MSSINQGGNMGPMTPAQTPEGLPKDAQQNAPQITAQESMTALPHMNLDANQVQNEVNTMLERAGLERTPEGGLQVKDAAAVGKTGEVKDLSSAEQIYAAGETQLKPPAPPKVELTKDLQTGAETFANNIDVAFNEVLPKLPELNKMVLDGKLSATALDGKLTETAAELSIANTKGEISTAQLGVKADIAKEAKLGDSIAAGVGVVVDKGEVAGTKTGQPAVPVTAQITPSDIQKLSEMSADALLAAFMKLNISDPNNSVETHNKIHTMMTKLRQTGIKNAKAKIKAAAEAKKEAEAYAEKAQYVSTVISVVMIVVTLVLTLLTFGAGAMLFVAVAMAIGAMIGAMSGGAEGALGGASIAGSLASFGVSMAATAAAAAAKTAAETAVKKAVEEALKEVTKETTQAAIQETVQAAVQKAVSELPKEVVEKLTEEALQKAMQDGIKSGLEKGLQSAMESGLSTVGKEMASTLGDQAGTMAKSIAGSLDYSSLALKAPGAITQTAASMIKAGATAGGETVKAGANMTAAQKMLDSQQLSIAAKRHRMLAEMMQQQIEEESEIMNTIMESKNKTVDSVIKMMNAMFASSAKLMSAGMAK